MIHMFDNFMVDEEAWSMYISGAAGTGKTTSLKNLLDHCKTNKIPSLVCAHTHKACSVIREKTPTDTNISTLHSFLNKRPGINDEAIDKDRLNFVHQTAIPDIKGVIFIDEYSMISDIDMCDILACQDQDYSGIPKVKVVYIGDPNQLPPIGEQVAVRPSGDYTVHLTKIWRQDKDSELLTTLSSLVGYIEGTKEVEYLEPNENFIRGADIPKEYKASEDSKVLAYTNEAVQKWNRLLQGRDILEYNDTVMSPTTREVYSYSGEIGRDMVHTLDLPRERTLNLGTKYKTLEFLLTMKEINFGRFDDKVFAYVFGHYEYKKMKEKLSKVAVQSNKNIEQAKGLPAKGWAKNNSRSLLARKRSKAWREFLCFEDSVICIDFDHSTTIHKAQGSTYDNVLLDSIDLARCKDANTHIRLWYVALSRARYNVYVNK